MSSLVFPPSHLTVLSRITYAMPYVLSIAKNNIVEHYIIAINKNSKLTIHASARVLIAGSSHKKEKLLLCCNCAFSSGFKGLM